MRRPPSIIDRRSVASARAPLATLRPLGTPSGYTRRNRLGGSTWWRPGRAAAGGHACLGEDPVGVGRHGGAPPSPPAAGCPWRTPRGTLWGGRPVVCRRERRGAAGRGQQSRGTWSAGTQAAQEGGDLVGLVGGQPVDAPLSRWAVGAGRAAAVVAESEGRMRRVESGQAQQVCLGAQRVGAPGTPAHAALAVQAHDGQAGTAAAAHGRDHAGHMPGTPGRRVAGPVSQPPGPERLALHAGMSSAAYPPPACRPSLAAR